MILIKLTLTLALVALCILPISLLGLALGPDHLITYLAWVCTMFIFGNGMEGIWRSNDDDDQGPPTHFPNGGVPIRRTDAQRGKAA